MFIGNTAQLDRAPYVTPAFVEVIERALAIAAIEPDGRYSIDGDDVFMMLVSTETKPKHEMRPEIHKEHLDIQILLNGVETFGISQDTPDSLLASDMENDVCFIPASDRESFVTLHPYDFVVFYPGEAHRPQCGLDDICLPIRKAVVKIHKRWFEARQ